MPFSRRRRGRGQAWWCDAPFQEGEGEWEGQGQDMVV